MSARKLLRLRWKRGDAYGEFTLLRPDEKPHKKASHCGQEMWPDSGDLEKAFTRMNHGDCSKLDVPCSACRGILSFEIECIESDDTTRIRVPPPQKENDPGAARLD